MRPATTTSSSSATPSRRAGKARGKNVWQEFYGKRKAINFGVSGDRTQHVLWRFEQGQLDGIKAKVAVVMIGTNNSNNQDNTEAEILEGVTAIVKQIRARQPDTKILLLGIFPRGKTFSPQRGKILEVNQALARLDDGNHIFYLDFGSQFIENDGSISKSIMPDCAASQRSRLPDLGERHGAEAETTAGRIKTGGGNQYFTASTLTVFSSTALLDLRYFSTAVRLPTELETRTALGGASL